MFTDGTTQKDWATYEYTGDGAAFFVFLAALVLNRSRVQMLFRARMVLLIVACVKAARRNRVFGDVYFPPVHGFFFCYRFNQGTCASH